jgi:hypothetical protein
MNAPPGQRALPQRLPVGAPPAWLPSERVISVTLVGLLVLLATIFQTSLKPGLVPEPDSGALVVPVFSTSPVSFTGSPTPSGAAGFIPGGTGSAATPDVPRDPEPLLPDNRIVAYYGHPADTDMGILGQFSKEELLHQLQDEAAAYERADPGRPVKMAFEIIGSVAQSDPGPDGRYVLQTDEATIREFIQFTQENDLLLIIDIQMGKTTVEDEMALIADYLAEPNVHLAIDPEFAWGADKDPATDFGSIDVGDINYAQAEMARIVEENNLPQKVLIVHRFTDGMVTDIRKLREVENVQFVLNFDGFGDPASKEQGYGLYVRESDMPFGGIKLFYDQDRPLMNPEDVVKLDPPPDFVMYQ